MRNTYEEKSRASKALENILEDLRSGFVLVEGEKDVASLAECGINAVPVSGRELLGIRAEGEVIILTNDPGCAEAQAFRPGRSAHSMGLHPKNGFRLNPWESSAPVKHLQAQGFSPGSLTDLDEAGNELAKMLEGEFSPRKDVKKVDSSTRKKLGGLLKLVHFENFSEKLEKTKKELEV